MNETMTEACKASEMNVTSCHLGTVEHWSDLSMPWLCFKMLSAIISMPFELLLLVLVGRSAVSRADLILVAGFTVGNFICSLGRFTMSITGLDLMLHQSRHALWVTPAQCAQRMHVMLSWVGSSIITLNIVAIALERLVTLASLSPAMGGGQLLCFRLRRGLFSARRARLFLYLSILLAVVNEVVALVLSQRLPNVPVSSLCVINEIMDPDHFNLIRRINLVAGLSTVLFYMVTFALWLLGRRQTLGPGKVTSLCSLRLRRELTIMKSLVAMFLLTLFYHVIPWTVLPLLNDGSVAKVVSQVVIAVHLLSKTFASVVYITVHPILKTEFQAQIKRMPICSRIPWRVFHPTRTSLVYIGK
ncbi:hypothetical protein T05_1096 [Trichinella murrelli]|uniref:G-protein coupled receptors family 1 profile domain-containing protein n=1 Tax=Trichinella murrelli TaxID=144512 RepID=A0A0V0TS11_9BILA|nr:hypothetical protein T05_1096 [Trichinella murrelli]